MAVQAELNNKTISLKEIKKNEITPEKIMTTVVKQLESIENISVYFKDISDQEFDQSKDYEISL